MRNPHPSPSIVPHDLDQDTYLVLDDLGARLGLVWRETSPERTGYDRLVEDLLSGFYSSPVRIVGFNVEAGWSRDVSAEVARELSRRRGADLPDGLAGFIEAHR